MAPPPALAIVCAFALSLASSPSALAQCQTGQACDIGRFFGPWEWNEQICADYDCDNFVEFLHGAVLPRGPHAGKVLLVRPERDVPCDDPDYSQSWLFDPASPATLIHIRDDDQMPPQLPGHMTCAGNAWDRQGRLILAGGFPFFNLPANQVFRFDPTTLGMVQFPDEFEVPCQSPYIDTTNAWVEIGSMTVARYYPSVLPLLRTSIVTPGECTDGIDAAGVVLGGPPDGFATQGNAIWELLDPDGTDWSCPLYPEDYPGTIDPNWSEIYARKPDTDKANPLLDSYPRGFQLSSLSERQVFVAGDTRTSSGPKPSGGYGSQLTGKEAWTMKVPYTTPRIRLAVVEVRGHARGA